MPRSRAGRLLERAGLPEVARRASLTERRLRAVGTVRREAARYLEAAPAPRLHLGAGDHLLPG